MHFGLVQCILSEANYQLPTKINFTSAATYGCLVCAARCNSLAHLLPRRQRLNDLHELPCGRDEAEVDLRLLLVCPNQTSLYQ